MLFPSPNRNRVRTFGIFGGRQVLGCIFVFCLIAGLIAVIIWGGIYYMRFIQSIGP